MNSEVHALFIYDESRGIKNTVFHIGNNDLRLRRTKQGGPTSNTCRSVANAINRVLEWVRRNSRPGENPNDTDYNYLISKLFYLVNSLQSDTIELTVSHMTENVIDEVTKLKYTPYAAKKKIYNDALNAFCRDIRVIEIIDRYTKAVVVDNIKESDEQEARLTSYDLYTLCMLFTFSRIFQVCYMTVMDAGDYMAMVSPVLFGKDIDEIAFLDILFSYVITTHYKNNIGMRDVRFKDRFVYNYLAPYIETKVMTDKIIVDKFAIIGVNKAHIYQKLVAEMFGGVHRIYTAYDIETERKKKEEKSFASSDDKDDIKDDFDPYDENTQPEDRKYYFKKIAKYISTAVKQVLSNNIQNFKPKFTMRVEGGDLDAEKDVFDSMVNENKENYDYIVKIRDDIVKDCLSHINHDTIKLGQSVNIVKHDFGKFMVSLFMNIKYGVSEPVNLLSYDDYRNIILYLYDKLEDYENLRVALIGKHFSGVNSTIVELEDFEKAGCVNIPPFIAANVNKSLKILSSFVKNRYMAEIRFANKAQTLNAEIKDDLIRFLMNIYEIFKEEE